MADDEFTLRRALDRAAKARAILDNEMVTEAFATLRQAYLDGWEATSARDQDARERFWLATTVLTKVAGHLETVLTDGKIAAHQLDFIDKANARGGVNADAGNGP